MSRQAALWGRGFRPFFLGAAAYTCVSIVLWVLVQAGSVPVPPFMADMIGWHAHEMIYGFAMAVIAGFLLTAVANWTGWSPVRGFHLMGLVALWLAGRGVMYVPGLPYAVAVAVESAFIPALAVSLFVPLYKTRNVRNYVFLVLLGLLLAADLGFLLTGDLRALHMALLVIAAMVSFVGGRIIPAFTVSSLRQRGQNVRNTDQPWLDKLALLSWLPMIALVWSAGFPSPLAASAAVFSGIVHALRLRHYHSLKALCDPLLWILHAAYAWLIIGLFLMAVAGFVGGVPVSVALHALSVGVVGSATLGMMSRVALGHTGRPLVCRPPVVLAFYLMQGAALARVAGVALFPQHSTLWVSLSGWLWCTVFLIYLWVFLPILLQPRPDGQPA